MKTTDRKPIKRGQVYYLVRAFRLEEIKSLKELIRKCTCLSDSSSYYELPFSFSGGRMYCTRRGIVTKKIHWDQGCGYNLYKDKDKAHRAALRIMNRWKRAWKAERDTVDSYLSYADKIVKAAKKELGER